MDIFSKLGDPEQTQLAGLAAGRRADGRNFDQFLGLTVQRGVLLGESNNRTPGSASAMAKKGPITVVCNVSAELCEAEVGVACRKGVVTVSGGEDADWSLLAGVLNELLESMVEQKELAVYEDRIYWFLKCELLFLGGNVAVPSRGMIFVFCLFFALYLYVRHMYFFSTEVTLIKYANRSY